MSDTKNSNSNTTSASSATSCETSASSATSCATSCISFFFNAIACVGSALKRISFVLPLIIVLLLELLWFNFPAIESSGFKPTQVQSISTGSGIEAKNNSYVAKSEENQYIQLHFGKPIRVENIHIDLQSNENKSVDFAAYVLDGGNRASYIQVASQPVTSNLSDTKYMRLHAVGTVSALRLSTNLQKGDSFALKSVSLNQSRPFHFSFVRFAVLIVVAYILYFFAPGSRIYKEALNLSLRRQQILLAVFLIVQCLIIIGITKITGTQRMFTAGTCNNGGFICDANQYNHLANSILSGHLYLDLPVPDWLPKMSNPYDAGMRYAMSLKTGQPTYWDYAFHGNHYFTYFGAIPALLLFVPFKAITGHDLRTDYAVAFFAVAFALASIYLLIQLLRRFFPKRSLGFLMLSQIVVLMSSGILIQAYLPKIYSLPMLSSLFFTFTGLGLFLQARKLPKLPESAESAESSDSKKPYLRKSLLILGALCIAMNLGCRPQFILSSLFAFVIFKDEIVKYRLFFAIKRKSVVNTLCVILPMLIVGLITCWYNYARFGSPFDFGATYNLTGFDMVHRSYSWARIPWGAWMYLFQPITITPVFPFIEQSVLPSMFHGQIIMEPFFGGLLAYSPICAAVVLYPIVRKNMKQNNLTGWFRLSISLAVLLIVLDAEVVGISSRYFSDFGWLLALCAIIVIASLADKISNSAKACSSAKACNNESCVADSGCAADSGCNCETSKNNGECANLKLLRKILVILTISSLGLCSLNLISNGRYSDLLGTRPSVYRSVESWFSPLM